MKTVHHPKRQLSTRRQALLVLACTLAPLSAVAVERSTGNAYGRDGRLAYTETHWRYLDKGRDSRLVLYRCQSGAAFARKKVVVDAGGAATPGFDFIDARNGHREGVESTGALRRVYWMESERSALKQRTVLVPPDAVIDAGFDPWVRTHWASLDAGAKVKAQFLIPSRAVFLPVQLSRRGRGAESVRFEMGWDSWLGFAAPSVTLVYRESDRRLLAFEGIGSVRTRSGAPWPVRIEFPPQLWVADASSEEVASAMTVPLSGSCE